MTSYASHERQLTSALHLTKRPIAVAYRETAPDGVDQFDGTMPSTCSFWRLAADGRAFYTVASDHYNCPIGSYTHNISLPEERADELNQTLKLMTDIGYLRMEEVPGIPRLKQTPNVVIYAPLGDTPVAPDAVIVSGLPSALMLAQEAALRAGLSPAASLMGRPTCMAVPMVESQPMAASLGCIGNRTYTDVGNEALYLTIAGEHLDAIVDELEIISTANNALLEYHQGRRAELATS